MDRKKIDELFFAAVEKPPDQQAAFLDEACADDQELRREVEKLLEGDQKSTFLDPAVRAEAASLGDDLTASWTGRQIGPYKLFRELGHGGMGEVYLAGRVDDEFRQQVTVKLIKPGMDTEGILRRFRNERQILAGLNHPNISRLLDGGTTERGQPYLVMEYIEGEPIDRYCDRHKLSIEERLELFCQVCSAVQFAHQNLVVHRDLKPANILVTAEGGVKLLDFGVAKLLNPELSAQTVSPTGIDLLRFLTPSYASPEQVRGGPITTVTDVYSLGVLLYELLAGRRPYRFASTVPQEVERVICETEPAKPSVAAVRVSEEGEDDQLTPEKVSRLRGGKPEALKRKLAGDLDNIVLKAMRKEPQRRYVSAEQLADDIRRHLRGLPVIARPSTFGYRAGKFVRRNKLLVAFVALLFVFAVGMTIQSYRVAQQRDIARREYLRAEEVSSFLVDLFKISDPSEARGQEVTARELLDKGATEIALKLRDQPVVHAKLMNTMGVAYMGLGLFDDAQRLIDSALTRRRQASDDLGVAESLNDLGAVLFSKGDYDGAKRLFREALEMRIRLLTDVHIDVAETQYQLAQVLNFNGEYDEAEELVGQALAIRRRQLGENHSDVARSIDALAAVLVSKGEHEAAEPLFREALEMWRRLGEEQPDAARNLNNVAYLLQAKGEYKEAELVFREAVEMWRRLLGAEHPTVATGLNNIAMALYFQGNYEESEPIARQALEMRRRKLGGEHPDVAGSLNNLAGVLVGKHEFLAAESLAREALRILRRKLPGHWRIAYFESTLGACLAGVGRYQEAEPLLLGSYPIVKDSTGGRSVYTKVVLKRLIALYESWGKPDKVEEYRALLPESDPP